MSTTRKEHVMRRTTITVLTAIITLTGAVAASAFGGFGDWGEAVDIEEFGAGAHENFNTSAGEGCPFISPDGKKFFIASNRANGEGGLDIWVSTRASESDPWGEPQNLGPPINSAANDFCPTIARDGKTFFFVSTREGHCGDDPNGDIYTTRFGPGLEVDSVTHLGCEVNSAWDEHSPFPINIPGQGPTLFYSSARPADASDTPGDHDLYSSLRRGSSYGPGELLEGVNTDFNDGQPNVRRDGQEIFFWSDRPGGHGGPDIYSAERSGPVDSFGEPENLGPNVNSAAGETRPSLSWDGRTLYFGRGDIFVTTR